MLTLTYNLIILPRLCSDKGRLMLSSSAAPSTTRMQLLLVALLAPNKALSGRVVISMKMVGGYTTVGSVEKVGWVQGSAACN